MPPVKKLQQTPWYDNLIPLYLQNGQPRRQKPPSAAAGVSGEQQVPAKFAQRENWALIKTFLSEVAVASSEGKDLSVEQVVVIHALRNQWPADLPLAKPFDDLFNAHPLPGKL